MGYYIKADYKSGSPIDRIFDKVSNLVGSMALRVDAELSQGGIDTNATRAILQEVTGADWDFREYSTEEVRKMWAESYWDIEVDPGNEWAFLSAYYFLKTCAELNLSIRIL